MRPGRTRTAQRADVALLLRWITEAVMATMPNQVLAGDASG